MNMSLIGELILVPIVRLDKTVENNTCHNLTVKTGEEATQKSTESLKKKNEIF